MPDPSPSPDPRPIADLGTDDIRPLHLPDPSAPPASASEGYELEGFSVPDVEEHPRPVELPTPTARPKSRPQPEFKTTTKRPDSPVKEGGSSEFETEVSDIDPVWTRAAEWGPDLVRVGISAGVTLFLFWMIGFSTFGLFILMVGGAATAFLSYPILVTMERPVRITPEQAVNDFYAAASHHFPHYRRMWLLLSPRAREEGRFSTFDDFRDHWKGQIEGWRAGSGASKFAPLKFEVESFLADKSTGKSTSRADYTILIYLRDREDVGPIESFKMTHGLAKGPDRMWYLNRGRLGSGSK